jgi:uncharacterized protein
MAGRTERLESICDEYGVRELYSFGSRSGEIRRFVRGELPALAESPSDIDIGARFRRDSYPSPRTKVELAFALEDFFGAGSVDLVPLEDASPFLALEIIRGELLYAGDPDDQARYELYVMARAGDLMYYERERRKNNLAVRVP